MPTVLVDPCYFHANYSAPHYDISYWRHFYELLLSTHETYDVFSLAPEDETFEKVIGIGPGEFCIAY